MGKRTALVTNTAHLGLVPVGEHSGWIAAESLLLLLLLPLRDANFLLLEYACLSSPLLAIAQARGQTHWQPSNLTA